MSDDKQKKESSTKERINERVQNRDERFDRRENFSGGSQRSNVNKLEPWPPPPPPSKKK